MRCFADGAKAGAFAYSGRGQRLEPSLTADGAKAGAFAYAGWPRLESSTKFVPYPVGMAKNATGYSTSTERKGATTWMLADGII